jgi:heat shock protein HslJ
MSMAGGQVLSDVRVTASFSNDGRVSGSAGCNAYSGTAAVEGGRVKIGLLLTTLMACNPEAVMSQEGAYLGALQKSAAYRVAGGELQLGPASGAATLVFKAE